MIDLKAFNWLGDQIKSRIFGDIDTRMRAAGQAVVARAQTLAPQRSGHLRASIGYVYRQQDHTLQIYADAMYAIFVEYGTRHMRPQPYIRPALLEAGRLQGINLEIGFANVPHINAPILAHPGGKRNVLFSTPNILTHKQLQHVRKHLVKTSSRLHHGNVKRAHLRVRTPSS